MGLVVEVGCGVGVVLGVGGALGVGDGVMYPSGVGVGLGRFTLNGPVVSYSPSTFGSR